MGPGRLDSPLPDGGEVGHRHGVEVCQEGAADQGSRESQAPLQRRRVLGVQGQQRDGPDGEPLVFDGHHESAAQEDPERAPHAAIGQLKLVEHDEWRLEERALGD